MNVKRKGNRLRVRLVRDLNLLAAHRIQQLAADAEDIRINIRGAKFVDSEALIRIYQLLQAGKRVRLDYPPPILEETVHVLGLAEALDLDTLIGKRRK